MTNLSLKGFPWLRFALVALCALAVLFVASSSSQASTVGGEGDQVINLCEWEPMSCGWEECVIKPWFCVGIPEEEFALKVDKVGSGTVTSSPSGLGCGSNCSATFETGTVVGLTAKASAGSEFSGWSGAGCSGTGTCTVTLSKAQLVTATFVTIVVDSSLKVEKTGSGTGTVTSEPAGINCGVQCEEWYPAGTEVTLIASAGPGSEFGGWTGCGSEVGGKCVVTLSDAKVVKATFNEAKALSVQKKGTGLGSVKSSPAGISCMTTCDSAKMRFPGGAIKEVTLTASPSKVSTFVAWGGDCTGSALACKLTLSADKSVTAEFAPIPKVGLTLNKVSGAGTVKSSPASINCAVVCPSQTSSFYEGSEVTLTATPYNSTFVQWTGACSGSSPTCKVTMSEAQAVGAEFTGTTMGTVPLTLTKTAGSTGTGKVQVYAGRINCDANCTASTAVLKPGAKVVLKQTPSIGSTFVGWGGACSGSGACEVTLSEAKEATAEFKATPANALTVNKAGGGRGTVKSKPAGVNCGLICSQTVALFPQTGGVTLTAVSGQGFGPVQWIGCDEVTGELCVVAMDSVKEVTAKFE